jgi:hypothetical protein
MHAHVYVGKEAVRLVNHSFRIMWGPGKGRMDIEKGVEVEVDVPTRVCLQWGAMTECDSVCVAVFPPVVC